VVAQIRTFIITPSFDLPRRCCTAAVLSTIGAG
jgi:hypothetical protein